MLCGVSSRLTIDVSGQNIHPAFLRQAALEAVFWDCVTVEDGTDMLSRNVGKQQPPRTAKASTTPRQ